ncbi:MAG: nitroreductase family protein [Woeseia sp.]
MNPVETDTHPVPGDRQLYDQFMEIARNRITTRQFDPGYEMPAEHFELVLEAARHAPSGANSQPWHYIVIRDPDAKQKIADYFVAEQRFRARLKMKFPTPNYAGLATAPGMIVVVADFRYVKAFPMLKDDDSDLNRMYMENAERILLQSVAASTMSAHLAASALGYNVWWVTAIGQQKAQEAMRPLLKVPEALSILDIMCFGPPLKEPYKRWKKSPEEIIHWDVFNRDNFMTDEELDVWIREKRHKVMYKDAAKID